VIRKVRQSIESQKLLSFPSKIIVGLSGGADSVVLLYVLQRLGYDCVAAHCNFHLRGEESFADEKFSEDVAKSLEIPFLKQDFDTEKIATERGISIEMAARDLRYAWFETLRQAQNADVIAVAHHRDDSIETMLLNLIRGTGIKGLTGIVPKNGNIIRPLLCVSKQEILDFVKTKELSFRTDSSNLQDEYTRNKIRLSLLPLLKTINPSVDEALLRTMEHLNETEKIYQEAIKTGILKVFDFERGQINIAQLRLLPSPESVLFELLKIYGFGRETVQDIVRAIDSQSGKEFYSADYRLIRDRDYFLLVPREQKTDDKNQILTDKDIQIIAIDANFTIKKDKNIAYFDADKLQFPLHIRKWEIGDKFVPFGMNSLKKVSDYFTNHKFSKIEKENTRLLISGEDIIWIIGHRTDNRYRITPDTIRACIIDNE
jgi:tRNA(Ile)-lysidine synthase